MGRAKKKPKDFAFEQLSDAAKEKARDWWRGGQLDDGWYESTYRDAIAVFTIFGFEVTTDDMSFSGFWSQGDGASFSGPYRAPEKTASEGIAEYAPKDEALKALAERIGIVQTTAQLRFNDSWKFDVSRSVYGGNYVHSGTMDVTSLEINGTTEADQATYDQVHDELTGVARGLADWLYRQLEAESEYLTSAECCNEALTGSDYRFDELGHII